MKKINQGLAIFSLFDVNFDDYIHRPVFVSLFVLKTKNKSTAMIKIDESDYLMRKIFWCLLDLGGYSRQYIVFTVPPFLWREKSSYGNFLT